MEKIYPRQADLSAYKKRMKDGRAGFFEWGAYCIGEWDKKPISDYTPKELTTLREFYRTLSDRKQNLFRRRCLTNSVADFVQREKKEKGREKKEKDRKKMTLPHALKLLNICFTVNKNVKKWAYKREYEDDRDFEGWVDVDYNLRDYMYAQKTSLIIKVIRGIRENRLPIKYGKNRGIVYFEYLGRQVSFHDPGNVVHCKPYAGVWCGRRNKRIPFEFNNKI